MNTSSYSQDYIPPAPVLPVRIAVPDEPSGEEYSALVDTGADGTFVPTVILEGLELPISYMANVRSHLSEILHRVPIRCLSPLPIANLPGSSVAPLKKQPAYDLRNIYLEKSSP